MADREKVIKGLDCCLDVIRSRQFSSGCGFCPYADAEHCKVKMIEDAIAMLKEQAPRLLTMEEITGGGECWFEGINGARGYADCYMCTGSQEVEVNRISRKPEYVLEEDFMKKWRCWTSRPTDEQRKAVKWE